MGAREPSREKNGQRKNVGPRNPVRAIASPLRLPRDFTQNSFRNKDFCPRHPGQPARAGGTIVSEKTLKKRPRILRVSPDRLPANRSGIRFAAKNSPKYPDSPRTGVGPAGRSPRSHRPVSEKTLEIPRDSSLRSGRPARFPCVRGDNELSIRSSAAGVPSRSPHSTTAVR